MILHANYSLKQTAKEGVYRVEYHGPLYCPNCGNETRYLRTRKRTMKFPDNKLNILLINHNKCPNCGKIHAVLPTCVIPYKLYATVVVEKVLDTAPAERGYETEALGTERPTESTMLQWRRELKEKRAKIEAALRRFGGKVKTLSMFRAINPHGWLSKLLYLVHACFSAEPEFS